VLYAWGIFDKTRSFQPLSSVVHATFSWSLRNRHSWFKVCKFNTLIEALTLRSGMGQFRSIVFNPTSIPLRNMTWSSAGVACPLENKHPLLSSRRSRVNAPPYPLNSRAFSRCDPIQIRSHCWWTWLSTNVGCPMRLAHRFLFAWRSADDPIGAKYSLSVKASGRSTCDVNRVKNFLFQGQHADRLEFKQLVTKVPPDRLRANGIQVLSPKLVRHGGP
jgi:hypothetical protein